MRDRINPRIEEVPQSGVGVFKHGFQSTKNRIWKRFDRTEGNCRMARMDTSTVEKVELATLTGSADALFELGLLYSSGREVEENLVEAHKWFNLAAMKGNRAALEYRQEISRELSRVDIAKAQRSARQWLQSH